MKKLFFVCLSLCLPWGANANLLAGVAKVEITPPIGTPSAGYTYRKGAGMEGVHDPLFAIALFLDNEKEQIALCSVDHLGFTYDMTQAILTQVQEEFPSCHVFIGSSHTHSGGGSFLNIPRLGEAIAGRYDPAVTAFYVNQTAKAIIQAGKAKRPAKVGIGYRIEKALSYYRSSWPIEANPPSELCVIKVVETDGSPLAVLFNYAVHPTILSEENRLFSADFVGYARDYLQESLGAQAIFFNGAQGDILPVLLADDRFEACSLLGNKIGTFVKETWDQIETEEELLIDVKKRSYQFIPQATPFGLTLPVPSYQSEINLLVLNQTHAFLSMPGELSSLYDQELKSYGCKTRFSKLSILGLTNDAHGYLIKPDSWRHKTAESGLSFGGEFYGERVVQMAKELLEL